MRPSMNPSMQVFEPLLKTDAVFAPSYPIDTRRRISL